MKSADFARQLGRLGFPLLEPEEPLDANVTLATVVKRGETRLWEGFPVMLARALDGRMVSAEGVLGHLPAVADKRVFVRLLEVALALYRVQGAVVPGAENLVANVNFSSKSTESFHRVLKVNGTLKVAGRSLSAERLKNNFERYAAHFQKELVELGDLRGGMALSFALGQLLSVKQRELFFKKFRREKLTKTEREYYSRVVRKKVAALADPELHRLAQQLAVSH